MACDSMKGVIRSDRYLNIGEDTQGVHLQLRDSLDNIAHGGWRSSCPALTI